MSKFKTLYSEIEQLLKHDQHHIVDEAKFNTLKNQVLDNLKTLFGETSREYRVVKCTKSPSTVYKVMNHIASRTNLNIAANM
ncbi:hypothetical protein [Desulfitobacterium sp. Sab5]|uniref:hypothetical protein n=1 Tax=Desulfitobacterium TaxID=36853 RepID=UPI003CF8D429